MKKINIFSIFFFLLFSALSHSNALNQLDKQIKELEKAEDKYLDHLQELLDELEDAYKSKQLKKQTKNTYEIMKSSGEFYQLSQELSQKIDEVQNNGITQEERASITDIIDSMNNYFSDDKKFADNYINYIQTHNKLMKNKKFQALIEQPSDIRGLSIEDLAVAPIEMLSSYKDLFTEIKNSLNNLSETDANFLLIKLDVDKLLKTIKNKNNLINSKIFK